MHLVNPPAVPFPAVSGIPFPRGAVTSLEQLRLESPQGVEVPAQFTLLASWSDGSVKSALLTTIVPGGPSDYILRYGAGITRAAYATGLACDTAPDGITVTTGLIKFHVDARRLSILDQVWVDANKDQVYDDSERVLTAPADLLMVKDAGGPAYHGLAFTHPQVSVEECGPMRVVIKATGKLQAPDGKTLIDAIVRITAFAQQEYVMLEPTVVDTRPENVEEPRGFSAVSYDLVIPAGLTNAAYAFGQERGEPVTGGITGPITLLQEGQMRYINGNPAQPLFELYYEGAGKGLKAPGWVEAGPVTVAVRHFWQQFPMALTVAPDGVTVGLHPLQASQSPPKPAEGQYVRPSTFYFNREGGAKTYELLVRFGRFGTAGGEQYNDAVQNPPRLMASAAWYGASGVFGNLLEAGDWSQGYDRHLIDGIYEPSVSQAEDAGGYAVLYGWRDFGDRLRPGWVGEANGIKIPSFYNDTHVGSHVFFIQYLRTMDPRWWDLAERSSRHWMDIDVSHTSRHGYHKVPIDPGPGEGYLIKHEMIDHDCRNLHWGHAHLSGLPDYYLLTGDPRALDVIKEVGSWWVNVSPYFFKTPVDNPHGAEAERDYAWPLFVMNEAYRATGDVRFLRGGAQLVEHLIGWWQTPSKHLVNKQVVGANDWREGTGWWYMYPKCDNCSEGYNGTNPWMAGPLLSSVIQFSEYQRDYKFVDEELIQTMLLQCMNYVVKYGWETSRKWKPYDYFVYSEGARETDNGSTLIVFPLAYLGRMVRHGVPHPEHYDTAPMWLTIARQFYDGARDVKWQGSTTQGFYGYETVWPADFWAIMRALEQQSALPAAK